MAVRVMGHYRESSSGKRFWVESYLRMVLGKYSVARIKKRRRKGNGKA